MNSLWPSNVDLSTESYYKRLSGSDVDDEEVLKLCEEYFEIAVGIRKPTKEERDEAGRIMVQSLTGDETDDLDRIRAAKYPPLDFSNKHRYAIFSILEYAVFKKLAKETDKVDGPYIPILRAELYHQLEDFRNGNMESALMRQAACFETYCRMKLSRARKTQWKHLNIESIGILENKDREFLDEDLRDVRDDYAHDWRVYITGGREREELRDVCTEGLGLLAKLHRKEIANTYQKNCETHISKRYASEWRDRPTGTIETSVSATTQIICEYCGCEFAPEDEGWKRCPKCDTPHDYLEK